MRRMKAISQNVLHGNRGIEIFLVVRMKHMYGTVSEDSVLRA